MGCGGSTASGKGPTVVSVTTKDPKENEPTTEKKVVSTKTKVKTIRFEEKVRRIIETITTYDDGTTSTSTNEQEYTVEDADRLFGVAGTGQGGNAKPAADITDEEAAAVSQAVIAEMTKARTNPQHYVEILQGLKTRMQGNVVFQPNRPPFTLKEGPQVLDEAITFLQGQKPLVELTYSPGLTRACQDHVLDIGPKGAVSHEGSNGSDFEERLKKYGDYNGRVAENLSFARFTAEDIVLYWLLSDGEQTRQQRNTLFDPIFTTTGVFYGTHATSTAVCCALFAFSYHESKDVAPVPGFPASAATAVARPPS